MATDEMSDSPMSEWLEAATDEVSDSQMSELLEAMSDSIQSLVEDWELLKDKAKTSITQYRQATSDNKLSCVLESFIDHLPEHGSKVVCKYIIDNEDQIQRLGDHLLNALLIRTQGAAGKTPSVDPSPFSPSDEVAQTMEASTPRQQATIKARCLQRDDISNSEWPKVAAPTNATHIIPYRLGKYGDSTGEKELSYIWTSLYALFPRLKEVLGQSSIHEERNVMTTSRALNDAIGQFQLALEATDEMHVYKLVDRRMWKDARDTLPAPNSQGEIVVRFKKYADVEWELPSPEILAVHAALGRVLNARGMAEAIEKIFRDFEEIRNMHEMNTEALSFLSEHLPLLVHG